MRKLIIASLIIVFMFLGFCSVLIANAYPDDEDLTRLYYLLAKGPTNTLSHKNINGNDMVYRKITLLKVSGILWIVYRRTNYVTGGERIINVYDKRVDGLATCGTDTGNVMPPAYVQEVYDREIKFWRRLIFNRC